MDRSTLQRSLSAPVSYGKTFPMIWRIAEYSDTWCCGPHWQCDESCETLLRTSLARFLPVRRCYLHIEHAV